MADAIPFKISNNIYLKFYKDEKLITDFDSISIDIDSSEHVTSTGNSGPFGLIKNDYGYEIYAHLKIHYFTVFVFENGKKIESKKIINNHGGSSYKFEISQDRLDIIPSFFKTDYFNYFLSLVLTIIVETLIGLYFYKKYKTVLKNIKYFILTFILLNLITHFSLWITYFHIAISILLLEFIVVLIEALYWRFIIGTKVKQSILISFLTNLVSFIIGLIFM